MMICFFKVFLRMNHVCDSVNNLQNNSFQSFNQYDLQQKKHECRNKRSKLKRH